MRQDNAKRNGGEKKKRAAREEKKKKSCIKQPALVTGARQPYDGRAGCSIQVIILCKYVYSADACIDRRKRINMGMLYKDRKSVV